MDLSGNSVRRGPNLAQQVYLTLCKNIITGALKPGERLVLDRTAEQLGVSPTPVREAVARLASDGLIVDLPNGRMQVLTLTPRYVQETFAVRGALEGLAAELTATRITAEQLVILQDILAETTAALGERNYDLYSHSDDYLHRLLIQAAANSVLSKEMQALQVHIDFIRAYSHRNAGEHISLSHVEHLRIYDALADRDPLAARHATEQHIRNASSRIVRLIDFQEDAMR